MALQTENLVRCLETLEEATRRLQVTQEGTLDHEILRIAVVKGFELSLEVAAKLLRKALRAYFSSARTVEDLTFKEVFRQAAQHGLMELETVQRFFGYRDNRNSTAHDYGSQFAEETLSLLPAFIEDSRALVKTLNEKLADAET